MMHDTQLPIALVRASSHPETGEPMVTVGFARPDVTGVFIGPDAERLWAWLQGQLTHPLPVAPRRGQIGHRRRMQRLRPRRKRLDDEQD